MAKFDKRLQAHKLRREGWSIGAIANVLEVSKSSASVWCSELVLTKQQEELLSRNAILKRDSGRIKGALTQKRKKEARIAFYREKGKTDLGKISNRDFFLAGIALYWAEGTRKSGSKFSFTNSEPEIVKFMMIWLGKIMDVKKTEFMPRIFINAIHEPRINQVKKFWATLLGLPVSQFGKLVLLKRPPRKVYENYDTYYGVLNLGVHRGSELKYRTLGLIEALRDQTLA